MQCLFGCNRMDLLSPGKVNKRRQQGECLVLPACGGGPTHKLKVFTEPAAFGLMFYTPLCQLHGAKSELRVLVQRNHRGPNSKEGEKNKGKKKKKKRQRT